MISLCAFCFSHLNVLLLLKPPKHMCVSGPLHTMHFSWNALLLGISTPISLSFFLTANFSMIPSLTHYLRLQHSLIFFLHSINHHSLYYILTYWLWLLFPLPTKQAKREFIFMFCSHYLKQGLAPCRALINICCRNNWINDLHTTNTDKFQPYRVKLIWNWRWQKLTQNSPP